MEPKDVGPQIITRVSALARDELRFLSSIAKRAFQSVINEKSVRDLRANALTQPPPRIRIATLSCSLPDPANNRVRSEGHGSSGRYLRNGTHYDAVRFHKTGHYSCDIVVKRAEAFLEACREREQGPHYLLLNELALCADDRADDTWRRLAQTYSVYIVPGTFHCPETFFGVAPIYGPRRVGSGDGEVVKQNTASRMKENIRTPDLRRLELFPTDYGNVVVWICLDVYDPGLVLKYLNASYRLSGDNRRAEKGTEIHITLIPSYNSDSTENIDGFLQDLSRFSKTVIVCANTYVDANSSRLESFGYFTGEKLLPVFVQKVDEQPGSPLRTHGVLYEFSFGELQRRQATNFLGDEICSTSFLSIVNGGHSIRDLRG